MVKKQLEWQHAETPNTPSKVREYIEACKNWLLATSEVDEEEVEISQQPLPVQVNSSYNSSIAVIPEHIYNTNRFCCFICGQDELVGDGKIINANPFTRAQCMLICHACDARITICCDSRK